MNCAQPKDVVRYLEGDLTEEHAAALGAHFQRCEACSRMLKKITNIGDKLSPDPDEFDRVDVTDNVLALIRLDRAHPKATKSGLFPGWYFWKWAGAFGAAVLLIAIIIPLWLPKSAPQEDRPIYLARGQSSTKTDQWVSIHVFRKTPWGYQLVEDRVTWQDKLAFAYQNRAEAEYDYLMILALDAKGQIFWYYPAYQDESENPQSISILRDEEPVSLPDEVQHDLHPGALRVFAIFSKIPLRVKQVEQQLLGDLDQVGSIDELHRIDLQETGQHTLMLNISRD